MARWHLWFVVPLLVALAACGSTPITSSGTGNTSPGTSTPGPIVIATDHATYAPTDRVQVTLTNGLSTAVYAPDHQASCSIFRLQHMVNGAWQDVAAPLAGCPLGRATIFMKIAPGTSYHAAIIAGYLRQGDAKFPAGQYRLAFSYATTPLDSGTGFPPPTDGTSAAPTVYSATLTIDPNTPPEPLPSQQPGNGTPTSGTIIPSGTTQP